ncbi:23S rRNA (uracil(1939)-C(5))-methyltransferase RlmD [Candidatus Izemoplasma sp. B36]|uniref:23S rRNA (uracil(1939)-C(5))-methyltransferase RlmD n=1 Tax=Candidatus Izemoplasma sp. B36 TaxID=3242468 RepID=UPI0035585660
MNLVKGDQIKLDIRKQGINGEGIGYYNKTLVFVPGAILKEKVFVEIEEVSRNFAIGKITEFIRVSKKRIKPVCKYYDECGGCQLQHIDYKEQLKIKQSLLKQALRKYTNIDVDNLEIKKTKGMEDFYHYRNKSQMPFKNTNFGLALGFYKPESNHFVYVEECINHHDMINKINKLSLRLLRKYDFKANDNRYRNGSLYYLVTRYLEKTNSASVTFVVNEFKDDLNKVAVELMKENPVIKSVSYSLRNRKSNLVISSKVNIIAGSKFIDEKFDDLNIKISPDAFHQLNSKQMEVLYDLMLKTIELNHKSIVFDLYSGIGITSILLAKHVRKVYGIDYAHASIKDAIENARINKVNNIDFIKGHVEEQLPKLVKMGIKPHLVLLDPPRKGLAKPVVDALRKSKPKQIIYISCNPSTLAKNISELNDLYEVKSIQPIDMFPNTASVESITLLRLK